MGTGLDYSARTEEGYGDTADPFPSELLIPRSEWQARIQEMEEQKSRLSDTIVQAGIPPKNQAQTPYCWINAIVGAEEVVRAGQNQPYVELSPASAGARIKNFRAVGGWGREAIEWVQEHGVTPTRLWPNNAIDRQYLTDAAVKEALKYRVGKYWVLDNSIDQIFSCLLRRIPVCVGLAWWQHEVYYVDPLWIDGQPAVRPRNSWGDLPQYPNGFFVLQGRKMSPDDSVAPRSAYAA
jgi:hypothetical protein